MSSVQIDQKSYEMPPKEGMSIAHFLTVGDINRWCLHWPLRARVTRSKESIRQSKSNRGFSTIVPPYIAALGSCDLSRGVNERKIALSLINRVLRRCCQSCKRKAAALP
jgi:hypothetical protein